MFHFEERFEATKDNTGGPNKFWIAKNISKLQKKKKFVKVCLQSS